MQHTNLIKSLQSATKLLDLARTSQLSQDINLICQHLANPNFQIAVFGPFNHGKSTLLNAILGNRTLPIDLIPTTGAAITVKYGTDLRTRIIFVNGREIYRSGTDILQQFAILDGNRQMRSDVVSVEVFFPHPFLESGVEFVDLPGTNDREAQEKLVCDRLLSADLVIQLLDARKLMTLSERENLRDWLLDRGIKTVIFVANFLNLLEPEEQKQVQNRLLFVAESFRSELPPGFSNLYRVDALPALRAKLKEDITAANTSGLSAFETALQNIVAILKQNRGGVSLPRVQNISSQIQLLLIDKIHKLSAEVKIFDDKQNSEIEIKQKAKNLIQRGFNLSVYDLQQELNLSKLLTKYQADFAVAMAENNLQLQKETLKKDFIELHLSVTKWLYQAHDFFKGEPPQELSIIFPNDPQINLPPLPSNANDLVDPGTVAIGGGIGWILGGPVGAAVAGSISYFLNKNIQEQEGKSAKKSYHQVVAKICIVAAENYLSSFSSQNLLNLVEYERKASQIIDFTVTKASVEITQKREQLRQLQSGFNQLLADLVKVNIPTKYQPYTEKPLGDNANQQNQHQAKNFISPPQKIYPQPIQDNSERNSERKVETAPEKVTLSIHPEELEAKFCAWEFDQEIAEMKSNIKSPHSAPQQPSVPQKKAGKEKIALAFKILGLEPNASLTDVKQAYRTLLKKCHPDLFVNQSQLRKQAEEKTQLINEAYNIIESNI